MHTTRKYHNHRSKTISIHHKCEGGIEKSIPMIADWHHKACRVMTISDREGRICREGWILTQLMDSFSCSPLNTSIKLENHEKSSRKS